MVPDPDWAIWVLYEGEFNHFSLVFVPFGGVVGVHMSRRKLPNGAWLMQQQTYQLILL